LFAAAEQMYLISKIEPESLALIYHPTNVIQYG